MVGPRRVRRHIDEVHVGQVPPQAIEKALPLGEPSLQPILGGVEAEQAELLFLQQLGLLAGKPLSPSRSLRLSGRVQRFLSHHAT